MRETEYIGTRLINRKTCFRKFSFPMVNDDVRAYFRRIVLYM